MRTARVGRALPALPLLLLAAAGSRGASAAAAPAPLAVSASLEPAAIRVGDAVRLTATVDHPAGWSFALPELERGRAIVVTDRKSATAALADRYNEV